MAAQTLPLSVEEFHKLYDGSKPAYEYWYGKAVQKSMPTLLHGVVQTQIMFLLGTAGWNVAPEVRLRVRPHAEPVPDVIAVRGKLKRGYPTTAPALCIEILSRCETFSKVFDKAKSYIEWGTDRVWIIDPEKRAAWTLSPNEAEPTSIPADGDLCIGATTIAMSALFSKVDQSMDLSFEHDD